MRRIEPRPHEFAQNYRVKLVLQPNASQSALKAEGPARIVRERFCPVHMRNVRKAWRTRIDSKLRPETLARRQMLVELAAERKGEVL